MHPEKKYSIILPVHNGGKYVKECISSILSQTYTDFNLLILENCSTDGTAEWLASLNDPRIHIYPSLEDLSIEQNWSRILTLAKDEFITLIGHDDVLMPEYLQIMNELINQNPNANLYQTHSIFINAQGDKIRNSIPMPPHMPDHEFIRRALQRELDLSGTGFMCRAVAYNAAHGIPLFPKLLFSDYALWFSIVRYGSVAISTQNGFAYRIHQNTSQIADPFIYTEALEHFSSFLQDFKKDVVFKPIIEANGTEFIAHFCKSILHKILRLKPNERRKLSVYGIVEKFNRVCKVISGDESYDLTKDFYVKLPLLIDHNSFSRSLFRQFRKIYKKPIR